jgi:SH3-like domain-containing protein
MERLRILPASSRGGGPAKLVEGSWRLSAKNPSTACGGPPPRPMPGRILVGVILVFSLFVPATAQDKTPPYWASIASGEAMTRNGPGRNYPGLWLYKRRDLPVRVLKRHEHWRLIEDPDGAKGWMLATLLSDRRTALIKPGEPRAIHAEPSDASRVRYRVEPGVVGRLEQCSNGWCVIQIGKREGYVRTSDLWGVASTELIDD